MAGAAQRPSAEEHSVGLLRPVDLGWHAGAHPSRALCGGTRAGGTGGKPDHGDHRQPERQGRAKRGALLDPQGYDAGKKVTGRKRHILVDTLGLLLAVVVTSAALSDPAGARLLLRRLGGACKKLRRIWVDGTYRGQLLEWVLLHYRFCLQPVLRSDEQKGFVVLPRRWVVERTFAWLTQCRRLGKEYEVLPSSSEAMIYIAMTRLMVRRLAAS